MGEGKIGDVQAVKSNSNSGKIIGMVASVIGALNTVYSLDLLVNAFGIYLASASINANMTDQDVEDCVAGFAKCVRINRAERQRADRARTGEANQ